MSRSIRLALLAVGAVVVLGAGLFWYLRDDAPEAVDLETAVQAVSPSSVDRPPAGEDGATGAGAQTTVVVPLEPVEVEGTWTVDAESGDFDFESATGTFAGFRVKERLSEIGEVTAVGRTGDVSGTVEIVGTTLTAATFEVDLRTLTTNDRGRDAKVQGALETDLFPTAAFVLAEPVELGETAADGQPTSVLAVGDLTIHGVTRRVQFPLEAQLVGSTIVAVGSLDLTFSDYGVTAPTAPIVLSVDEAGILELQVLLTKG
jgi:polyisoprenoid-binding protein YceI